MDPPWLKGGSGYDATVLRFIDNGIEKRKGDERLSAVIQFDSELDLKGLKGRFGLILGRWEGQKWATEGVVHVHLMSEEIFGQNEMTEENSRWVESHASYKKLTNHWLIGSGGVISSPLPHHRTCGTASGGSEGLP